MEITRKMLEDAIVDTLGMVGLTMLANRHPLPTVHSTAIHEAFVNQTGSEESHTILREARKIIDTTGSYPFN